MRTNASQTRRTETPARVLGDRTKSDSAFFGIHYLCGVGGAIHGGGGQRSIDKCARLNAKRLGYDDRSRAGPVSRGRDGRDWR